MSYPNILIRSLLVLVSASFVSLHAYAAMWDVQKTFSPEANSGDGGHAAVVFFNNGFWTAQWNSNVLYQFDSTGLFIDTLTIPGLENTRALTWDGTNIYAANNTDTIRVIDPTSQQVLNVIIAPQTVRHCSYDPTADGGLGGLWVGNWDTDINLIDLSGNQIGNISALTHGLDDMYGTTLDTFTQGGPYLWVFYQGGSSSEAQLERLQISTGGVPGNLQFDVEADLGLAAGALAGGLFITDKFRTGKVTLGGLAQGDPDMVFAYELDPILPDVDVALNSAGLLGGLYQVPRNHAQQMLFLSSVTNLGQDTIVEGYIQTTVYANGAQVFFDTISLAGFLPFQSIQPAIGPFAADSMGAHNVEMVVKIAGAQVDSFQSNDTARFSFFISDYVMSRDDGIFTGTNYFVNGDNWANVAVRYETTVLDSLGSVYVHLNDPSVGDTTYAMVWDDNSGEPGNLIAQTPPYIIEAGRQEYNLRFADTIGLPPGTYYFGVYEASFSAINLSQATNVFTPGVNFFRTGGNSWNASGISTIRVIRPQFDWDVVDCTQFSVSISQSPAGSVTEGDTITLSTGLGNDYEFQWQLNTFDIQGAIQSSYTFVADVTGTYSVEVMNRDSCFHEDNHIVSVQPWIGIHEPNTTSLKVSLFPNPSEDWCMITSNLELDPAATKLYNSVGEEMAIKLNSISGSEVQLDLSSIGIGFYFLEVQSLSGRMERLRVVRQ